MRGSSAAACSLLINDPCNLAHYMHEYYTGVLPHRCQRLASLNDPLDAVRDLRRAGAFPIRPAWAHFAEWRPALLPFNFVPAPARLPRCLPDSLCVCTRWQGPGQANIACSLLEVPLTTLLRKLRDDALNVERVER